MKVCGISSESTFVSWEIIGDLYPRPLLSVGVGHNGDSQKIHRVSIYPGSEGQLIRMEPVGTSAGVPDIEVLFDLTEGRILGFEMMLGFDYLTQWRSRDLTEEVVLGFPRFCESGFICDMAVERLRGQLDSYVDKDRFMAMWIEK